MVVQNTSVAQAHPPFLCPEDVPERVTESDAMAMLHALKPLARVAELQVDGIRLPTYEWTPPEGGANAKEPLGLLYLHGLGHDASDYSSFFTTHASRRLSMAFDMPGFGLADKPRRSYPLDLLQAALFAGAQRFAKPPIVVASSLGGHVAMLAALERPAAFSGLVLLAPGGLNPTPLPIQSFARAYYAYESILRRSDHEILKNAKRIFVHPNAQAQLQIARKIAIHRSPLKEAFAWPFASVVDDVFRHPVGARISEIQVPVHIVCGEKDVIVPAVECRIAAQRAGIPFHSLPAVGHVPMVEAPAALATLIEHIAGQIDGEREARP